MNQRGLFSPGSELLLLLPHILWAISLTVALSSIKIPPSLRHKVFAGKFHTSTVACQYLITLVTHDLASRH